MAYLKIVQITYDPYDQLKCELWKWKEVDVASLLRPTFFCLPLITMYDEPRVEISSNITGPENYVPYLQLFFTGLKLFIRNFHIRRGLDYRSGLFGFLDTSAADVRRKLIYRVSKCKNVFMIKYLTTI